MRLLTLPPLRRTFRLSFAVSLALLCAPSPSRAEDEELTPIDVPSSSITLAHKGATITAQAFSPDGGVLAVGMTDGTVALYSLKRKRWTVQTPRLHGDGIQSIALSSDGALIATSSSDSYVAVADAHTGAPLRRLPTPCAALCVAFSPNGRTLAAGLIEGVDMGRVRIWSVPEMRVQRTLDPPGSVFALSFSATGDRLLAAANDSVVYALPAGKKIWSHDNLGARTAAISADGKVVGGGQEIWSVDRNRQIADPRGQNNFSGFSRNGGLLVGGSEEDGTSVFDGHTGKLLSELRIFEDFCAVSPDATLVAAGYGSTDIALYRIDEKALRKLAYDRAHPTKQQLAQKALENALDTNDLAKVKAALAQGADPNVKYRDREPLLMRAASSGDLTLFQTLLAAGARFTPADPDFANNVLESAIDGKNLAMLTWLLDHGVAIPAKSSFPPVYVAARDGDPAVLNFLLDHGAAIDAREFLHGETALMQAAENKKADAVQLLLKRGANPALMTLADPTDKDYVPVNALTVALMNGGDLATATPLVAVTPNLNDSAAFHIPLGILAVDPKSSAILSLLLDKGLDPNARDPDRDHGTALIAAARRDCVQCAALLIAHHADVNAKDSDGRNALDQCTNDEIRKMLTDAGAVPTR